MLMSLLLFVYYKNCDFFCIPDEVKKENELMKEAQMCKICCEERVSIVFLPCGHLVSCAQCAPALKKCPMCRKPIKGSTKVTFGS